MGEAKRRKQQDPSFGQETPPKFLGYVIFFDDQFLVRALDLDFSSTVWCTAPSWAKKYTDLEDARAVAFVIAKVNAENDGKDVEVLIQRLLETKTQFITEEEEFVRCVRNQASREDNDNVGSYDSIMETFGDEEGFYEEFGVYP